MSHDIYSAVGYSYRAENYCLDCTPGVLLGDKLGTYNQDDGCNCTECVLDRVADDRGIERRDERTFDMDDFPKYIPYHNDLHAECGCTDRYGDDPSCYDRCEKCGEPIDGPCPAMV